MPIAHDELIQYIPQFGVPNEWEDTVSMQNLYPSDCKGWRVKVHWGQSIFLKDMGVKGNAVFAGEFIPKGTVLRHGIPGKNIMKFSSFEKLPKCLNETTCHYLSMYMVPPCVDKWQGRDLQRSKTGVADNELFMWLPGCGSNHCIERKDVEQIQTVDGFLNCTAFRDIEKGEELYQDYTMYGQPPQWYVEFLNKFKLEGNFAGTNNYAYNR